ncbi:MAG: hypothetical protein KC996_05040 [Phycisphaerales bacterium]|nr:hypothetical protein [Phycisphaerales bacterium]
MDSLFAGSHPIVPIMIFGSFALVGSLAIMFGLGRKITLIKEREKSRREIAAYVAEGSMTPEDAERLLNSMNPKQDPSSRC